MLGITQGALDLFGQETMAEMPSETVTYRTSGQAHAAEQSITGAWGEYSRREKAMNPMLVAMRRFRVAHTAFAAPPVRGALLRRTNGEQWDIQGSEGGPQHAFWFLTCKQVG